MTARSLVPLLLAATVGAAWGAIGQLADRAGDAATWATALGAPWLLLAFVAGATAGATRRAALAGAVALVAGVLAYYVAQVAIRGGAPTAVAMTLVWSPAAALAGALFGAAGAIWRDGRALAGALVPATLAGEALVLATRWDERPGATSVLAAELALAAVAPLALARGGRPRAVFAAATVALTAVCVGAELALRGALRRAGWMGA